MPGPHSHRSWSTPPPRNLVPPGLIESIPLKIKEERLSRGRPGATRARLETHADFKLTEPDSVRRRNSRDITYGSSASLSIRWDRQNPQPAPHPLSGNPHPGRHVPSMRRVTGLFPTRGPTFPYQKQRKRSTMEGKTLLL